MPEEDLKALLSKVASDPALQQKLEAQRVDTHWFVVLAKEAGFSITVDNLKKQAQALESKDLQQANGERNKQTADERPWL
ncbi:MULTISPECIES: Nif11-like leader peptide family natural product precursor [unclassified Prochlorococcus]|uniref:Nif11-like leader peptide family natural product precursor n=1 Tax=unclassified Prochlorococcus TaxID=2627481 RepID=UPI000533BB17|nr:MULTISPECIES: Nif11-like leader peptide family natural product precursor [unclassified Prochlorococcus]KGG24874.1 hypothetical protein EV12_2749 [Prochlorococcus sp. MIT 0701]KGG26020.1 hypothetical protein EV13_2797 [Prochlorococcus sp. MIT 0702]KGG30800.1 hypothetical protein EV14_2736 [Prochlorococcus sp. MIT 0703]